MPIVRLCHVYLDPLAEGLLFSFELCKCILAAIRIINAIEETCYFLLNYAYMQKKALSWKASLTACYFLLNYARIIKPVAMAIRRAARWVRLAIFFWIMQGDWEALSALTFACYFLLNYACTASCTRKDACNHLLFSFELCQSNTSSGSSTETSNLLFSFELCSLFCKPIAPHGDKHTLAIFFWIMPHRKGARVAVIPKTVPLLFSFELCIELASLLYSRQSIGILLFSFELCLLDLHKLSLPHSHPLNLLFSFELCKLRQFWGWC